MYLVKDRFLGRDIYVFSYADPREDGYDGDVTEDVDLDYDILAVHRWPDGEPRPDPQLGSDPRNPKQFKVFRSPAELKSSGFRLVQDGTPEVVSVWSEQLRRYHPEPEEFAPVLSSDEWFDYLERTDSAKAIRWRQNERAAPGPGSSNEQIAQWVADRHMGADGAIDQVWYLPAGAPANEIRLLEVNSRYSDEGEKVKPIDFGLDVDGREFKLYVADVSGERLDRIRAEPIRLLPAGWKLENARTWDRKDSLV